MKTILFLKSMKIKYLCWFGQVMTQYYILCTVYARPSLPLSPCSLTTMDLVPESTKINGRLLNEIGKNARKLNGKREHGAKEWENQLHFPLQLKFVLLVCAFFLLADSLQLRKISNVLQSSNGAIHYPKVAGQSLKIMCNAWYEFCCNKRGWPVDKQSNNNCTGLWKLRSMGN